MEDVLFFCVDDLPGFTEIQRRVIHMLRNPFKYASYKDLEKFASDFKAVYNTPNEAVALSGLENVKEAWRKKYPYAIGNCDQVLDQLTVLYG